MNLLNSGISAMRFTRTPPQSESSANRRGVRLAIMSLALLLSFAVIATILGCSGESSAECPEGMDAFVSYQLFMGRSMPDGNVASDADWNRFLAETVTPRFPDGLTVLDASGQWRNSSGIIEKEQSKQLVILAPPGEDALRLIGEVSEAYKSRFNQESVLKVVEDVCVSF